MCEVIKPRFKVGEPVYVIAGSNDKTKVFITYIHKIHEYKTGYKSEGGGPYYYFMYSVDTVQETGNRTPQFVEEFIHERFVQE